MFHLEIIINEKYPGFNPIQFGYEDCTPSKSFGPTVRTFWLFHYVVSGTGIFQRNGETYQVKPGEIFVIPPFLETYYEADKEVPWKYIWVGFETNFDLPDIFHEPVIRCPGIGTIFEDMRHCQGMDSGKSAFISSRLWELISAVLESSKPKTNYIKKALHCIESEYMNDLNVKNLAERLNLDRCYFSTLFMQHTGVSPAQYILNFRLNHAADLMVSHGVSPSIAAASVGYNDIYNFSKMFKKKYGLSPRQYVKNAKDKTNATKDEYK